MVLDFATQQKADEEMTEERRPEGDVDDDGALVCPHCQNADQNTIYHGEYVLMQRPLCNDDGIKNGKLMVDAHADEVEATAKDAHFFCDGCNGEFSLPQGIRIDFE